MGCVEGLLVVSRYKPQDMDRPNNHRGFNGGFTERVATDGYSQLPSIPEQRRRIARDLEIERLRRSIHRCDELPVRES